MVVVQTRMVMCTLAWSKQKRRRGVPGHRGEGAGRLARGKSAGADNTGVEGARYVWGRWAQRMGKA